MEKKQIRYTRRNKKGIKMRWTCLIALDKMQKIKRASTTKLKLTGQCDWDKVLANMNKWYLACKKCPPRHYGEKWNKEKEIILRQCEELYLSIIKYSNYYPAPFMSNDSGLAGPSDRYINISRITWNPQENGWDYSHSKELAGDQYWKPQGKKPVKIIKQGTPEHDWAKLDYEAHRDYYRGHKRVVPNGGAKLTRSGEGFTDCGGNGRFGQRIIVKNGY